MTTPSARAALTEATRAVRTALDAGGAAQIARISSRPVRGGGYPDGTIRTEVQLHPQTDNRRIVAALRNLPRLVDLQSTDGAVVVWCSPTQTAFGPGGRDGLTVREAIRQSQLIHPDWSPATHLDWLIEDGYPLEQLDRATVEAMVGGWLAAEPPAPPHRGATSASPKRAQTPPAPADGDPARLPRLPPGARLLSPDEAVELLVIADHPDRRNLVLDVALIDAIRSGELVACRLATGQLAFTIAI